MLLNWQPKGCFFIFYFHFRRSSLYLHVILHPNWNNGLGFILADGFSLFLHYLLLLSKPNQLEDIEWSGLITSDLFESPAQGKRLNLIRLLHIIKSSKNSLNDQILAPLMSMLSVNLFRPLPPPSNPSVNSDLVDEEDPISTPSPMWSHLQLIYDILLRLVINTEPRILREYIDYPFLQNLLTLFQSEDPRERESLKNVYHRIYTRFTSYRFFMRKSMNDVFLHYAFDTERHSGIGELLEIWGSIINGFTVPLKEEHSLFLMRVLIPLHKTKGLQAYHRQLAYCVSQFVQKEPVLGGVVVRGILKYWPITNCQKEVFLITELEELVENVDPDQYRKLALPLCTQITRCLNSWNSQVAERALYIWNNEQFVKMASTALEQVFPVVVEGMEKNLKWHWSKSVLQLTENVKTMLEELDPILYAKCLEEIEHRESVSRQAEIKRQEIWDRIEMAAAQSKILHSSHYICVSH
ncbi:serine/threonine protein phosphatase 2A 57 kDa regulatory subunit B' beta isoform isoform X1 [Ziziphus jujuba]|uniref:Serine/threonine protein phosphatase 2A 57 kDa regulatory subunit B' beta isoform isoform X1 n=1 Tax=Ziziphus jujuba TaxID=326968 RepID=A0A6P6GFN4_ZIZJJ|nr:serine/threonine protein phosphatase 2A 57 kDa regulatory subunit B' beta isoform isoform X1 [Ziziphus jujuba]XP_060676178.1 serine/threonine protein phosphatase 2A 57 kDa regulatory subunit B' beta isoform isoform X1 [Ziziphus jujuba]XP_060676179.1 serine/threonine protein phosphatase 2A 57 kDa regulatory subunit B' beta isoform isoform X1 [Ziziphus jujuba]